LYGEAIRIRFSITKPHCWTSSFSRTWNICVGGRQKLCSPCQMERETDRITIGCASQVSALFRSSDVNNIWSANKLKHKLKWIELKNNIHGAST
jgi:hypothetical protein